jgi:hypothetical protein
MTRDEITQAQSGWETNMAALQTHTLAQGKFAWQMLWTGGKEDSRGTTCPGQRRSFPPTFARFFTGCTTFHSLFHGVHQLDRRRNRLAHERQIWQALGRCLLALADTRAANCARIGQKTHNWGQTLTRNRATAGPLVTQSECAEELRYLCAADAIPQKRTMMCVRGLADCS